MSVIGLNTEYQAAIQHKIDQKTKPVGSLGLLEDIACQLALIQSQKHGSLVDNVSITEPSVLVFAADHGISDEGVSIAPSAVTRQMVLNFINGGAAINCFCRSNRLHFKVIDAGIIEPINDEYPDLVKQRLGSGTNNFVNQSAMTAEQAEQGLSFGQQAVETLISANCTILILGEMGIGNTSSASAILSALTDESVDKCVGVGTGITDEQLIKKQQLISQALSRFNSKDPMVVLKEVGGFEIAQMVGAIIAAAKVNIAVLVDGFIVSTAALLACKIEPNVRNYLIFAHQSEESGHQLLLRKLAAKPLLNLGLRLGEGTGAALALPLLTAAASFYNDMASFEDAGVTV